MNVIVTDTGFGADDWTEGYVALSDAANDVVSVDVPSDADPKTLEDQIRTLKMVRINFPTFADGRGFTIARRLRLMGYQGRLRAHGHVISDQYAMARRSGFDEVEISDDLASRQPEAEWLFRANWQQNDYQAHVRD